ncbi:uncharacterized protein BcabD6B2_17490 [Babesia caballi]|uniref:Uncharacterized protein n=1 Tax=Babesia caballi TaxID=5871 RepID=A0AAV4LR98_BABCB|nr:hypothetical protein, conserved [Babesia caballi]
MLPLDTPHPPLSSSLSDCPSNLKEAIDWILRVTGKYGGGGPDGTSQLAEEVKRLLEKVESSGSGLTAEFKQVMSALDGGQLIAKLAEGLLQFIGYKSGTFSNNTPIITGGGILPANVAKYQVCNAVLNFVIRFLEGLLVINGVGNTNKEDVTKVIATLRKCVGTGQVPKGFTDLVEKIGETAGEIDKKIKKTSFGLADTLNTVFTALKDIVTEKFQTEHQTHTGNSAIQNVTSYIDAVKVEEDGNGTFTRLNDSLKTLFSKELIKPSSGLSDNETIRIETLKSDIQGVTNAARALNSEIHSINTNTDKKHPLPNAAVFIAVRDAAHAFLAELQFSSAYEEINVHIGTVLSTALNVADSGSTQSGNKLSADQIQEYLRASCAFSSSVLGMVQGPGASNGIDEPYLHHLFGNGMSFAYPSGAALLSKISEYAYALQFQLSFLTQKCSTNFDDGCGWRHCRFGSTVEPTKDSNVTVSSHICHAGCTHSSGSSGPCQQHNGNKCGTSSPSPLQAFLTDNLQGFRRGHPGTSDYLSSCSPNSMCHVPMGFKADYLRETPGYGYHVFYPLLFYCSDHTRPLRLLSDKLHCISNYTPRSLGDMLGFYLHLTRQVFNKRPDNFTFPSYIADLLKTKQPQSRAGLLIFESLEESIVELGSALHGVVRHCHNKPKGGTDNAIKHQDVSGEQCSHSNKTPADLWSLFALVDNPSKYPNCGGVGQKCGAYLSPLTRSYGSTFGKSAGFASTYLSWVSYLADDFKERLEGLLTDFTNITCTDCKTLNGGTCSCTRGNHGGSQCSCDSVVSCSGVLSLLYAHGFNFFNVNSLSGKGSGNSQTKRTCAQFHCQLQNVINGNPLSNLLTSIDTFLFLFRYYFLSNLSGFWTIYICLILYTFVFLLDTLHLRSHLKLTASHTVPPLALLTSGKARALTKLTYIGQ